MKKVIILCLFIVGCGNTDYGTNGEIDPHQNPAAPYKELPVVVDERARPHLNSFQNELNNRGIFRFDYDIARTNVYFSTDENPLLDPWAGFCNRGFNSNGQEFITITIRREIWQATISEYRELLLFHELGHCILRQNHGDNEIMSSGNVSDYFGAYYLDRELLLNEFFSNL